MTGQFQIDHWSMVDFDGENALVLEVLSVGRRRSDALVALFGVSASREGPVYPFPLPTDNPHSIRR